MRLGDMGDEKMVDGLELKVCLISKRRVVNDIH
jgi:hypothetical protein